MADDRVPVVGPDGSKFTLPRSQLLLAAKKGYRQVVTAEQPAPAAEQPRGEPDTGLLDRARAFGSSALEKGEAVADAPVNWGGQQGAKLDAVLGIPKMWPDPTIQAVSVPKEFKPGMGIQTLDAQGRPVPNVGLFEGWGKALPAAAEFEAGGKVISKGAETLAGAVGPLLGRAAKMFRGAPQDAEAMQQAVARAKQWAAQHEVNTEPGSSKLGQLDAEQTHVGPGAPGAAVEDPTSAVSPRTEPLRTERPGQQAKAYPGEPVVAVQPGAGQRSPPAFVNEAEQWAKGKPVKGPVVIPPPQAKGPGRGMPTFVDTPEGGFKQPGIGAGGFQPSPEAGLEFIKKERAARAAAGEGTPALESTNSGRPPGDQTAQVDRAVQHAARFATEHPEDTEGRRYLEQMVGGAGGLKGKGGKVAGSEMNPFAGTRYDPKAPGSYEPTAVLSAQLPTRPPVSEAVAPKAMLALDPHIQYQAQAASVAIQKGESWLKKAGKFFVSPANRAEAEAAIAINQHEAAARANQDALERIYPQMRQVLDKADPGTKKAIQAFVNSGLDNVDNGVALLSKTPMEFQQAFSQLERRQDFIRNELLKAGHFTPEEAQSLMNQRKLGQVYMRRSYKAILDKKWVPPEDVLGKAINYMVTKGKANPDAARQAILRVVESVKNGISPEEAFASGLKGTVDRSIPKARTLPKFLQPVLGLVRDPAFVVSNSAAEMERLYHQLKVSEAFTQPQFEGKVWSKKPMKNMATLPIGAEFQNFAQARKAYGSFAGKYVTPEMYEALHQAEGNGHQGVVQDSINAITNYFRTAKVLTSVTTAARNALSNSMYMAAAGVNPLKLKGLMMDSLAAMNDWGKSLTIGKGPGQWMQWALEDNALAPGRGAELGGASNEARHLIAHVLEDPNKSFPAQMISYAAKAQKKLGGGYELMDRVPRLMTYMHHVKLGLDQGMSLPMARARAASMVNRYFASGASVGQGVKQASRGLGGLINPFLSWHVDNVRVARNIAADAAKLNLGPALRTAMWWGVPSAIGAGARALGGVGDADIADAEAMEPESHRQYSPLGIWVRLPNRQMYKLSVEAFNPFATWFNGNEKFSLDHPGSIPKLIATNIVQGAWSSGALQEPGDAALRALGAPVPDKREYAPLPGMEGLPNWAAATWDTMQPTLVKQFSDTLRRTQVLGQLRPTEEPLTAIEGATKAMGLWDIAQTFKAGEGTRAAAQAQYSQGQKELSRDAGRTSTRMMNKGQLTPEQRGTVQDESLKRKGERAADYYDTANRMPKPKK